MKNIIERIAGGGAKIATYLSIAVKSRLAVAALAALAAGGAGAATYMMSNADGSAMQWDGGYTWNSGAISFNLSNPSGIAAAGDFPASGKVALTCISISSRKDAGNSIALDHVVLTAANGRMYTSSRVEVSNTPFTTTLAAGGTYNAAGSYGDGGGRYTINIYFDSIEVDVTSPLTIATYTSATATGTLGTSVVRAASGSGSWYAAMRIYGTSIDTATVSTPVLLVDANGDGDGTAVDPNTVEWLGLAEGNTQSSATQGGARLAVTVGGGRLWKQLVTDSFANQSGTFLAPSATTVTADAFASSALAEVKAELGLDATQTDGLSTALNKGLYNGQNKVWTQTVEISGLTTGQNYTLYLAASGFTNNNNAKPTPYVALTGFATGTTPVIAKTSVSATGWTESANLSAAGTDGELTLFRIRNLYANSSGQVTLSLSDGTHGYAGFNMVALAKTKTPKCAAVVGGVKALSSIAIDSSNLVSGSPISSATIGEGALIQSGSVVIGNSGIQIPLAETLSYLTVMMKVSNIPSSASRLLGWAIDYKSKSGSLENFLSYTGTQFEQHYYYNTGVAQTTYGNSAWTRDANEHWIAVTYVPNGNMSGCSQTTQGTRTYLDGTPIIEDTTLIFADVQTSKILIGGLSLNGGNPATGMVVKDVMILADALTREQIATVTAALNKGWTPVNAAGTTLSGTNLELPDSAARLTGTISIASDGSYSVSVSSGTTTLPFGAKVAEVASGATVYVTTSTAPANLEEAIAGGYALSATLTVPETVDGTIALVDSNGNVVTGSTSTYENGVRSFTGTAPANPTYTGSAWWWDYEFDGNGNNIGSDGTELQYDTTRPTSGGGASAKVWENGIGTVVEDYTASVSGNQMVYLLARPWRHVADGYPSEFTAVMYCKAGTTANAALVCFGSREPKEGDTSVKRLIALTTGGNPSSGQMRLVLIDPTLSGDDRVVDLVEGGFRLDNITTANHLYAFTVRTVDGVSHISVYADGELLTTYIADSIITLGTGFQIGSIHGSIEDWMGLSYLSEGDNNNQVSADTATMDFLRVSNTALTSEAIKALAKEYPYVSPNGIATRVVDANGTWSDSAATPWSQKALNQDGSSTTTDQAAPNSGTVVDVIATADATLTMNLDSAVTYEKLTFEGAGAITVVKGGTAPTVTTRTYIKTDTTLPVDAFASLGAITVDDGKTLTLIPASSTTYTALGLGIRGTTSTVLTGTVTLGGGATVALDASTVAEYAEAGISLSLEQNASLQYVLAITRQDGDVTITKTSNGTETATMGGYPLPAIPATIPSDFANSVAIVNNYPSEFTVATVFNGGAVPVTVNSASAPVVLTGDSTFGGAVSGTATLTISGDITLASGGSIASTIAGAGTVTLSSLSQTLTFGAWTGTVALPALTANEEYNFNAYGVSGSTVRLAGGFSTGWLANAAVNPAIEIPSGQTFTLGAFSPSYANAFAALKGDGTFAITATANQDNDLANVATWGAGRDHYSAYFRIGDVSGFHGSIATSSDVGVALGSTKPAKNTTGGKILVYGNVTVGETATWTAPNGVILADANATLVVPSSAKVPVPTTSVAGCVVKATTVGGTTTYSVVAKGFFFMTY